MVGSRTRFKSIVTASSTLVGVFEVLRWLQCGGKSLKPSKRRGDSWLAAPAAAAAIRCGRKNTHGLCFRTIFTGRHSSQNPRRAPKSHISLRLNTLSGTDYLAHSPGNIAVLLLVFARKFTFCSVPTDRRGHVLGGYRSSQTRTVNTHTHTLNFSSGAISSTATQLSTPSQGFCPASLYQPSTPPPHDMSQSYV